jgi:hypothetical protein
VGALAKVHVAWDKHALPVLVLLWFLCARGIETDDENAAPADAVNRLGSPVAH